MINEAISQLINNENLSVSCAKECFDEIFSGLATPVQASSFLTALESKGIVQDEQLAGILSSRESVKKISFPIQNISLIENIILDETFEYLDFALLNDLICATCNLNSMRYSFESHIFNSRSFNLLSKLGLRFNHIDSDFIDTFEQINFGYFYLSTNEPYYKYVYELKKSLKFSNSLNLFDKLLNPYCAQNLFLGIKDANLVEDYAKLALNLNNQNTLVVSGYDKTPFISIENESFVAEAWKNKIFAYKISPELLDIKKASLDYVKVQNEDECANLILEIIENKAREEVIQAIILNAGFALYISKICASVMDGLALASKVINDGKLKEKFEQIKKHYEV